MNCPACQSPNPPSMKFCVSCGSELAVKSITSDDYPQVPPADSLKEAQTGGVKACSSCDQANSEDAAFCNRCGLPLNSNPGHPLHAQFRPNAKPSWWRETGSILWWLIEISIMIAAIIAPFGVFYEEGINTDTLSLRILFRGFVSAVLMTIGSALGLLLLPNPIGRRMRAWLKKRNQIR